MKDSSKSTVMRGPKRACYDIHQIHQILDASFLCHVSFIQNGEARIIPTAYSRVGNSIYLHGNVKNQMLSALLDGQTACINVMLLDGLVLARSGFHHSVNYRSVVLFGQGKLVVDENKAELLNGLINHMLPGRAEDIRPHHQKELDATLLVEFAIDEASAKIRTGPPVDAEADYDLASWAGVVNLKTVVESIEPCPRLTTSIEQPGYLEEYESRLI